MATEKNLNSNNNCVIPIPLRPSRWRNVLEAAEAAARARGERPAVSRTVLDHARRAGK
ncbi:MAG: hypothetical protein ACYCWA_00315 [Thiobacillus sp.]